MVEEIKHLVLQEIIQIKALMGYWRIIEHPAVCLITFY